jgi:pyridoxal phosphate enzyme (YggS family)
MNRILKSAGYRYEPDHQKNRSMAVNIVAYEELLKELQTKDVLLVAVSKTKPVGEIKELYDAGQEDFGENYVQELADKQSQLPAAIRWHFIGHLQSNKVKTIAPFVTLIHGVDSLKLLVEIDKQAAKCNRIIHCLLQVHIAAEETKFGFDEQELADALQSPELTSLEHIHIDGLMGMASLSEDKAKVRAEFKGLKQLFDKYGRLRTPRCQFRILSMGMSGDYKMALEEGSNMVRIGSLLFGSRD